MNSVTADVMPATASLVPLAPRRRLRDARQHTVQLGRDAVADFESASRREWLVTNGIGGYAAGTVSGARTRRYHGLLVAALAPPLGRTMLLANVEVVAVYRGRRIPLSTSEFHGGFIAPDGYRNIDSFHLDGAIPVWRYAFADVLLEQRIWMVHGDNNVYVRWDVLRASGNVELEIAPLIGWRDYHAQNRGAWSIATEATPGGFSFSAGGDGADCRISMDSGAFAFDADWHWNYRHRVESYRGLDDTEDLFRPGRFRVTLQQGQCASLVAAVGDMPREPARKALVTEQRRQRRLAGNGNASQPGWIRQLLIAADQFLVARGDDGGRTVIAGYPWFGDWGRDTMIALPGLTLSTKRYDIAKRILLTFAEHVSEGMLPNRFPDGGETPEYNTVDATLWYFHAIDRYATLSGDRSVVERLYPALRDIVDWHVRGTRYRIQVDPQDGLLHAGEAGVQLTWMDAKVGDWVVTPRIGKPVEINALWHNALEVMARFAAMVHDDAGSRRYADMAARTADQFRVRYWNPETECLYDVIDGPAGDLGKDQRRRDASIRPNQLFAVSLSPNLLSRNRARAVVDVCARELYTPVGMRSLASSDRSYAGHYGGGPRERDGVYHQGTVWSWLLGPFASAHYRAYGDAALARSLLAGIRSHLTDGCVGTISEIFDGDAPHAPRGCFAQAWSVAEVLRAWFEIGDGDTPASSGVKT